MSTTPTSIDTAIRTQIDQFLTSISHLVRQAAVEAVKDALGATDGKVAAPARRGPGRPTKVAGASPVASGPKAKPGKRGRRSAADVEQVAGQVLAYVQGHPGERLEEIGRGLKVDTGGLKGPIKVLLGTGRLRTEGQKRGTKYFAGAGRRCRRRQGRVGRRLGTRWASADGRGRPRRSSLDGRRVQCRASPMITVHTAPDAQEASLLVVELRANGIDAEAVHDARVMAYGRLPNSECVQVQVPPSQLDAARSVLAGFLDHRKLGVQPGPSWTCASCGESNEPTFDVCWSCQAVAPSTK